MCLIEFCGGLPSRPTPHKFPSEILSRHWSPAVTSFSYNQQTMNGESSSSNAVSSSTASDSSNLINVGLQDEMLGFAVTPKTDCEHLSHIQLVKDLDDEVVRKAHCTHCGKPETWLCLTCGGVYCSRYQNNCAKLHATEASHPIALSLSDLSVWCYQCDDYITSPLLDTLKRRVYVLKFDAPPPEGSELDIAV
ncbi:unnamed protein product [Umbelopsis ramanniana]